MHSNIINTALTKLPLNCVIYIMNLTSAILSFSIFPNLGRRLSISPIPKFQTNLQDPTNFSAIKLLPTLSRIVERVIS